MASNHEYAVIGHSRATVGRFLGIAAGLASSGLAVGIATGITYAESWGFLDARAYWKLPLTAAIFYTLGHLAFDKWAWRTWLVHRILAIPDLRGKWDCVGETIDPDTGAIKYNWTAEVTISQGWEKDQDLLPNGTFAFSECCRVYRGGRRCRLYPDVQLPQRTASW
ncbi:hypothetical protein [Rhodoferax lithotrophicus]|uniref:hypothetical protein n=1 Tax=Rhodoferax lithotrophicus TaxID=2798804 RepID=UPI001E28D344|nr:hypothetical protein [Rhodoferax sp. MIZ03]